MHAENDVARSQSEKSKQKSSKSDVKRLNFAQNFRDPREFPYFPSPDTGGGYGGTVGSPGVKEKKKLLLDSLSNGMLFGLIRARFDAVSRLFRVKAG